MEQATLQGYKGKENIGTIMSNFDHKIEPNSEEKLITEKVHGEYAAWNFFGNVWYEQGKYRCEVCQHGEVVEIITADTLQEIMDEASSKYGYD